jgi:hypothetical protein
MFDSADSAGLWFDIFNGVLLLGAFFVLVGTWGTIKTSAIKERFADERTAANEAETKRAIADSDGAKEATAKADLRIAELSTQAEVLRKDTAEANVRAAEAQLELAQFRAPRKLDSWQIERISRIVAAFPGTPFDVGVTLESEPQNFASQIGALLEASGWVWKDRNNTPGLAINLGKHQAGMVNGGPAFGIEIDISKDKDWKGAVLALGNALIAEGIKPVMNEASDGSASPDAVHIYVGSKR